MSNKFSQNTLSGIHGTARMIFKKAVEFDIIKADPTLYAKLPREIKTVEQLESENSLPKYLEKDELVYFPRVSKEVCPGHRI